ARPTRPVWISLPRPLLDGARATPAPDPVRRQVGGVRARTGRQSKLDGRVLRPPEVPPPRHRPGGRTDGLPALSWSLGGGGGPGEPCRPPFLAAVHPSNLRGGRDRGGLEAEVRRRVSRALLEGRLRDTPEGGSPHCRPAAAEAIRRARASRLRRRSGHRCRSAAPREGHSCSPDLPPTEGHPPAASLLSAWRR